MQEQIDILMETAKAYLILAEGLKQSNLPYKHYAQQGKECVLKAMEMKKTLEELDSYMSEAA